MKSLARQFVWWPKLDSDIDNMVKSCSTCAVSGADPLPTVLHPWEWPGQPWSRIHVDYAGPLYGKMYLIIIDAHSKWLEVHITSGCTTATTIDKLQLSFSISGLPQVLVSDNGPPFSSSEFQDFMKQNRINHVNTVPYHPASNGLAEHAVKTFKSALKKLLVHFSHESTVFVQVSHYTTDHYWHFLSTIHDGTSVTFSFGFTSTKHS